jgi:predicted nucleic acid-binding protein
MTSDPPPSTLVLDASAAVALLADAGPAGSWVAEMVSGRALVAPELMPFEAGNILRRHTLAGTLDDTAAALAHADLTALAVELFPYAALAERAWDLRGHLTVYDAAYIALAELVVAPVLTLDARLSRAHGFRCDVLAFKDPA